MVSSPHEIPMVNIIINFRTMTKVVCNEIFEKIKYKVLGVNLLSELGDRVITYFMRLEIRPKSLKIFIMDRLDLAIEIRNTGKF